MDFAEFNCSEDDLGSPEVIKISINNERTAKRKRVLCSDDEAEGEHQPAATGNKQEHIEILDVEEGWLEKRDPSGGPTQRNNLIRKRQTSTNRSNSVDSLLHLAQSPGAVVRSVSSPELFVIEDTPPNRRRPPNVAAITNKSSAADRAARYGNRGREGGAKRPPSRRQSGSSSEESCDDDDSSSGSSGGSGEDLDVNEWDDEVDDISRVKDKVKHILDHCGHLSEKLRNTMSKWRGDEKDAEGDCVNLTSIEKRSAVGVDDASTLLQNEDFESVCPGLVLKDYQTVGVNWMRLLHENKVNGVLADDMGLGKTIQTIAFLSWLKAKNELHGRHQAHLVVVPASTLDNWLNEFERFGPLLVVEEYRGTQAERFQLQRPFARGIQEGEIDVLVCTYTMFERESGKMDRKFLTRLQFSYLVLDEAHCIKNSNSSRFEYLGQLQSRHRLLLSGTPVQNDIKELLNLLSFLTPKVFKRRDVQTLFLGLSIDEKNGFRGTSKELIPIRHIRTMMSPFVMRRMKIDVLGQLPKKSTIEKLISMCSVQQKVYDNIIKSQLRRKAPESVKAEPQAAIEISSENGVIDLSAESAPLSAEDKAKEEAKKKKRLKAERELMDLMSCTGPKTSRSATAKGAASVAPQDTVVSNAFEVVRIVDDEADKNLKSFDDERGIDTVLEKMKTSDINNLFTALRKAANHPLMLRVHFTDDKVIDLLARVALGNSHFGEQADYARVRAEIESFSDFDINRLCLDYPSSLGHLQLPATVLYDSAKMQFLKEKLPELVSEGHRILIFSQWTRIMDLLEVLLHDIGFSFLRLDGSTPVNTRQDLINTFNEDESIPVFLLSTKAGGLGINLTAADTVILHDLDMNPENDRQAEDRSHRIGQTRPVTVYKLVVEGTVDQDILDMGKRKTELINSVLLSDMSGLKKAAAAEDKAVIAALLQKAMARAQASA